MRSRNTKSWILLAASAVLGAALLLPRCFTADLPTCAYICGPTDPRCPDEYECRSDCYCHLKGSVEACGFPLDMGCDAAHAPDLAGIADAAPDQPAGDMPPADLGGTD
jgi:hypothetical protein